MYVVLRVCAFINDIFAVVVSYMDLANMSVISFGLVVPRVILWERACDPPPHPITDAAIGVDIES